MGYPIIAYRFTVNNYKNIEKYIDVTLNTTLNCVIVSFIPSDFKKNGSNEVQSYYVKVGSSSYFTNAKALKYLGLNENYEKIK